MTTTLEKAARALFDSYVRLARMDAYAAEPYWLAQKEGFLSSARAALEAIREIDQEWVWASPFLLEEAETFTAMIDAILAEK